MEVLLSPHTPSRSFFLNEVKGMCPVVVLDATETMKRNARVILAKVYATWAIKLVSHWYSMQPRGDCL